MTPETEIPKAIAESQLEYHNDIMSAITLLIFFK